ncbi:MAG: hypothetical protein CXT77_00220 [uncultured DHVE6 group euryarchaeote]|nr:MAG: hypothetical protein CXT77_00220 [uncultured DHVE6 group euryarchaeote]
MKKILTLLALLFLLPAALATTLTATSPLASNSVIEYSGSCSSAGAVGIQISFMGNMVHFDQITTSGVTFSSSTSTTPYTTPIDGDYSLSASCAGENWKYVVICVGSTCPVPTSEEPEESGLQGGRGSIVTASSSGDSGASVTASSRGSSGGSSGGSSSAGGSNQAADNTPTQDTSDSNQDDSGDQEEGSSSLLVTLLILALLIGGGFFLWKKYKKPQGYTPMTKTSQ